MVRLCRSTCWRLRTTAQVFAEVCELAEQRGFGSRSVELAANYARTLDGWCTGERTPADLVSAVLLVSRVLALRTKQVDSVEMGLLRVARDINDARASIARHGMDKWMPLSTKHVVTLCIVVRMAEVRSMILGEPLEHAHAHILTRGESIYRNFSDAEGAS